MLRNPKMSTRDKSALESRGPFERKLHSSPSALPSTLVNSPHLVPRLSGKTWRTVASVRRGISNRTFAMVHDSIQAWRSDPRRYTPRTCARQYETRDPSIGQLSGRSKAPKDLRNQPTFVCFVTFLLVFSVTLSLWLLFFVCLKPEPWGLGPSFLRRLRNKRLRN